MLARHLILQPTDAVIPLLRLKVHPADCLLQAKEVVRRGEGDDDDSGGGD